MVKASGVRSGHARHALHDQILRDEVDIVKFDEKYYLFGMKSEKSIRDEDPFFCVILDTTMNLGRKVRNRRLV